MVDDKDLLKPSTSNPTSTGLQTQTRQNDSELTVPIPQKKGASNVIYDHYCAHRVISDRLSALKPQTALLTLSSGWAAKNKYELSARFHLADSQYRWNRTTRTREI